MHWALSTFLYTLCTIAPLVISVCVYNSKTVPNGSKWLEELNQSPLTPKDYVFGVVWTLLYLLIGLSLAMLIYTALQSGLKFGGQWNAFSFFVTGILFYIAQLCVNYAYLIIMFRERNLELGLKLLYVVLALTALNILCFAPVSALAAAMLLPYVGYLIVNNSELNENVPESESQSTNKI